MATLTEVKPVPHFNLAISEDELTLIRSALIIMRNVKYSEERLPAVLRGQVSLRQSEEAGQLLTSIGR